jgi:hypothetical protein
MRECPAANPSVKGSNEYGTFVRGGRMPGGYHRTPPGQLRASSRCEKDCGGHSGAPTPAGTPGSACAKFRIGTFRATGANPGARRQRRSKPARPSPCLCRDARAKAQAYWTVPENIPEKIARRRRQPGEYQLLPGRGSSEFLSFVPNGSLYSRYHRTAVRKDRGPGRRGSNPQGDPGPSPHGRPFVEKGRGKEQRLLFAAQAAPGQPLHFR